MSIELTDPNFKETYDNIIAFSQDETAAELKLPDLSPRKRYQSHALCEELDLIHVSVGQGKDRVLVVMKKSFEEVDAEMSAEGK